MVRMIFKVGRETIKFFWHGGLHFNTAGTLLNLTYKDHCPNRLRWDHSKNQKGFLGKKQDFCMEFSL